jgi:hypothetical protein
MSLTSLSATSAGAGALTVRLSDTDFGPLAANGHFSSSVGGTALAAGASVTINTYGDSNNLVFGDDGSTAQSSQTFSSVPFSGAVDAPMGGPLANPYSLTVEAIMVHPGTGSSGYSAVLKAGLPEPASLAVWSLLGCVGLLVRPRRDRVKTA